MMSFESQLSKRQSMRKEPHKWQKGISSSEEGEQIGTEQTIPLAVPLILQQLATTSFSFVTNLSNFLFSIISAHIHDGKFIVLLQTQLS